MSRLATRGSNSIDQATIRGYVLIRLRRGEEEEVCTGGRAELYTCWGAKPLAEPLTRPCPGTRPGDEHQRRHSIDLKKVKAIVNWQELENVI